MTLLLIYKLGFTGVLKLVKEKKIAADKKLKFTNLIRNISYLRIRMRRPLKYNHFHAFNVLNKPCIWTAITYTYFLIVGFYELHFINITRTYFMC